MKKIGQDRKGQKREEKERKGYKRDHKSNDNVFKHIKLQNRTESYATQ